MIPVIWQLDEDGHATGQTFRFCCSTCAAKFLHDERNKNDLEFNAYGEEDGPQDINEICCGCGSNLDPKGTRYYGN